jgi:P4 family phage/plasmid primase-like protien
MSTTTTNSQALSILVANMPTATTRKITLEESYFDLSFLRKLVTQRPDSTVSHEHIAMGERLLLNINDKKKTVVDYEQRRYIVGPNEKVALGRFYPKQQTYQNMLGSMRRVLASGHYAEVDMVNAHFRLLLGKFPSARALRAYCDERDEHLASVSAACNVPTAVAKKLFIILIFGGSVKTWATDAGITGDPVLPAICHAVEADIRACKEAFHSDPESLRYIKAAKAKHATTGKPWENTAFAYWLQDLEATCMVKAIAYLKRSGVHVASLIHDGVLVDSADASLVDIDGLGGYVRKATGLECTFAIKLLELREKDRAWRDAVVAGARKGRLSDVSQLVVDAAYEKGTQRLLAKLAKFLFPDRFVYVDNAAGWYVFQAPRWWHLGENVGELVTMINEDFLAALDRAEKELDMNMQLLVCGIEEDMDESDEEWEEREPKRVRTNTGGETDDEENTLSYLLRCLRHNIGKIHFKMEIIREMRSTFELKKKKRRVWLNRLDADVMLLGFEDSVYDFREKRFREGRPEDMICHSTGHDRADLEADNTCEEEIMSALGDMHGEAERRYILNTLAISVVGERKNHIFHIWSGSGANGKGLTKNLAGSAFGEYYYEPSSSIFCERSVTGTVLSSELAKMKGKRLVITSEAEPGDKLRPGLLKQCAGNDSIQARDLYEKAGEFKCHANIILCFNEIPGVEDSSGAIARRLRVVRFKNKFVDKPVMEHHRLIDPDLQAKFSSQKYGAAFLALLIRTFNEDGFNFPIPASVTREATDYLGENDVLGEFMNANFEEAIGQAVPLKVVWDTLRMDHGYSQQLHIKASQVLSQKLKNKGYDLVRKERGIMVMNLKEKQSHRDDDMSDAE